MLACENRVETTLPSENLAKDLKNGGLLTLLFFHYALSSSRTPELARSYVGFTKLRCVCSYVSFTCQMAAPVGRGEENVTSPSQGCQKKGLLVCFIGRRSQHGKVALWCCFYPIWGMYGEMSYLMPLCDTMYLGRHGEAAGAAFKPEVFCSHSPKTFSWCLSPLLCSVMSGLWEPAGKWLFLPPAQSIIMSTQVPASPSGQCFP